MTFSIRQMMLGVACLSVVTWILVFFINRQIVAPRQMSQFMLGKSSLEVQAVTFECQRDAVTWSDRSVCRYFTQRLQSSVACDGRNHKCQNTPGQRVVFCGWVFITLSNGIQMAGPALLARDGIVLSLPPENRIGGDFIYTHYVEWNEEIPPQLRESIDSLVDRNGG